MSGPTDAMFNLEAYTASQLILYGVGCFGWVVFYAVVVREIIRKKFVEIPAPSVVTNISWEFVWSFLFSPDMGVVFVWGYRVWFVLDIFITYSLFRYGDKQVNNPILKRYFRPAVAVGIAVWMLGIYFFVAQGYDTPTGLISGYILNVIIAALYILLILRHPNLSDFSYIVAWSKMLGTAIASVFCFIALPHERLLLVMCVVCFVLDSTYIAVFHWRHKQPDAMPQPLGDVTSGGRAVIASM
jgi:hypothetical protein